MVKISKRVSGEGIDVCFTFDTTGSMYPCLTQVRRHIEQTVRRLFRDIPGLRIAIIAHGDYCDKGRTYVTKTLDFSANVEEICSFVRNVGATDGGDSPECYELVLNEARGLSWRAGKAKVIAMIGDDVPHDSSYHLNAKHISWRNELKLLIEAGINVYGIHAMPGIRSHSKGFYEEIARTTGGYYLTLDQFSAITDIVFAVCYKQSDGLEAFEKEVVSANRMSRNMEQVIATLSGKTIRTRAASGLVPVSSGRFQVLEVDREQSIKDFVVEQGCSFKAGRGFYQLTKPVTVQGYKEIVLMHKITGDVFTGPKVREMLGLPPQSGKKSYDRTDVKLRPVVFEDYYVFIQSTSYNRVLKNNTKLLYEVE